MGTATTFVPPNPDALTTTQPAATMGKSKLKLALAAEKGTDFKKLKEKRQKKAALKARAEKREQDESEDEEMVSAEEELDEDDSEAEAGNGYNLDGIDDSDTSDSSVDMEKPLPRKAKKSILKQTSKANGKASLNKGEAQEGSEDDEEEDEEEEDIPISDIEDLSDDEKEDIIPHQRLTINNTSALLSSLQRIALPTDNSVPFATHQVILSSAPTADSIPDVQDDLQRELAFYSQSLEAVKIARQKLKKEGVPFSRPKDYFAEMVKEDEHMEKIKAKLVEEATNKKAAAEARKLRDLKKFGKQVQVAKLQERQKAKRETLDKIKNLKRKRAESGGGDATNEADLFDVGVDKELGKPSRGDRSGAGRGNVGAGAVNHKRQKKNEKYGFGGKKRHAKSGDAMSSADLSGFNAKGMKAKSKVTKPSRPGKDRRKAMARR